MDALHIFFTLLGVIQVLIIMLGLGIVLIATLIGISALTTHLPHPALRNVRNHLHPAQRH
jgi:hypothetical protein